MLKFAMIIFGVTAISSPPKKMAKADVKIIATQYAGNNLLALDAAKAGASRYLAEKKIT